VDHTDQYTVWPDAVHFLFLPVDQAKQWRATVPGDWSDRIGPDNNHHHGGGYVDEKISSS
jgi:hypothetical protein